MVSAVTGLWLNNPEPGAGAYGCEDLYVAGGRAMRRWRGPLSAAWCSCRACVLSVAGRQRWCGCCLLGAPCLASCLPGLCFLWCLPLWWCFSQHLPRLMVVGSVVVAGVLPPPVTVAVLVTCFGALQDALTVSLMVG